MKNKNKTANLLLIIKNFLIISLYMKQIKTKNYFF